MTNKWQINESCWKDIWNIGIKDISITWGDN